MTAFVAPRRFVIVAGIRSSSTPRDVAVPVRRNPAAARQLVLRRGTVPGLARRYQTRSGGVARPRCATRAAGRRPVGAARGASSTWPRAGGRAAACVEPDVARGARARTATRSGRPGLFEQAESQVSRRADVGARISRAATTAWRGRWRRAGSSTRRWTRRRRAVRLAPRDLEIHHTVGVDLRADAQVRGGGRRVHQLRQPAAEQGTQRKGRLVARRDQVPALVRPARAVRDGSGAGRTDLYVRFPAGERQGRGARARSTARSQDFVVDTGAENTVDHAADRRSASASRRSPTRSAPASATSGCAACSSRASTRWRLGDAQAAQRAVPDQESAAARPADPGNREPVAARARLLDDHRLQDEADHVRQAPAGRADRLRAAAAAAPAGDGAAARSTARTARTSSSTPAAR